MSIYKAPETLVFSLKRFKSKNKYFKSKLETLVTFPVRNLDLSEFVLNTSLPQEYESEIPDCIYIAICFEVVERRRIVYNLYAVVNHYGGLGGGHYTAFAKNKVRPGMFLKEARSQASGMSSTIAP